MKAMFGRFRPRAFLALARTQMVLNLRQPEVMILTFGLPLLSMVVFGTLFGRSSAINIGLVDQDKSALSRQVDQAFRDNKALKIHERGEESERKHLKDGDTVALIVLAEGFSTTGKIDFFRNSASPVVEGIREGTVRGIIAGINSNLAAAQALQLTLVDQGTTGSVSRTIDFLTPGMMGLSIMYLNFAAGIYMVSWRQQGILRRLQVTPLNPGTLLASQMASAWLFSVFQVAVLFVVARVVFGVEMRGNYLLLLLVVVVGVTTMLSIGYLIAAFVRTPQAASGMVNLIGFPMMFLGGSYFPVDSVPAAVKPIVAIMPLTHLNDALRDVINHGEPLSTFAVGLLILLGWTAVCFAASARVFRWD